MFPSSENSSKIYLAMGLRDISRNTFWPKSCCEINLSVTPLTWRRPVNGPPPTPQKNYLATSLDPQNLLRDISRNFITRWTFRYLAIPVRAKVSGSVDHLTMRLWGCHFHLPNTTSNAVRPNLAKISRNPILPWTGVPESM